MKNVRRNCVANPYFENAAEDPSHTVAVLLKIQVSHSPIFAKISIDWMSYKTLKLFLKISKDNE